jgi:DNA-binding MarR family transcriptional regulator
MTTEPDVARSLELGELPGHLLRRAQQLHTALWAAHVSTAYTSTQFAALNAIAASPHLDQTQLGEHIGTDRSTTTDVVQRLMHRRDLQRRRSETDGRRNELHLTAAGEQALRDLAPRVEALTEVITGPLDAAERMELQRLLAKLITGRH